MSDYDVVRKGRLVLKGEKIKSKKRKHKESKEDSKISKPKIDEDALGHGGWWKVENTLDICGSIAIEFGENCYVKALDNGLFTLGGKHVNGEGPSPEEILTAFLVNENKIAFKSGYGKYLKIEKDGMITGRSEAIGAMEQWESLFQDGKSALLADNGNFMSIDPEDDACVALNKKVGPNEMLTIRSCATKENKDEDEKPNEEQGNLTQIELNYVKKFQKFQDKKVRINNEATKELELAKTEGYLHEKLLDRRSKMKADRYCK